MTTNFPIVSLAEVLSYRKEFIEINDEEIYKRCRVQLHAKGIVLRDTTQGAAIKTKKQQVCRAGEFLVAEIDAKVGGFGIVPQSLDGAIVSSHYFLFALNDKILDRKFLDYFIRTPQFHEQVSAQGSTNYAAIRPNNVLDYTVPLPPLTEQRRIVARIEELATNIEVARELRQQAEKDAKVLSKSGAEYILSETSQASLRPLKELVTIQGGGTPSKSNPLFWQGSIPWVSPKDMKSRVIVDARDHISEEATRITPAKLISTEAVLIVVRGMILAHTVPSAVLKVPAAINQDMKALVVSKDILPDYLCSVFWALNDQLLRLVEKSTHDTRKLETHRLLDFKIPVPSIHHQKQTLARLNNLQSQVETLKVLQTGTAAELDALMPAILDKAFRGEL